MLGLFSRDASLKRLRKSVTLADVLTGNTCSPIALEDLFYYLKHVEHSEENLQFIVWYQDYRTRFFELPEDVQHMSPGGAMSSRTAAMTLTQDPEHVSRLATICNFFSTTRHSAEEGEDGSQSSSRSKSRNGLPWFRKSNIASKDASTLPQGPKAVHISPIRAGCTLVAVASSVPKLSDWELDEYDIDPAIQPLRDECMRVSAAFLSRGSGKELSLDQRTRDALLANLTWSTHPDVFMGAYQEIYALVENSSFPQFLIIQSMVINYPRRVVWSILCALDIMIGLTIGFCTLALLDLPPQSHRGYRVFGAMFFAAGCMQGFSAYRGFCMIEWCQGKMQRNEWELNVILYPREPSDTLGPDLELDGFNPLASDIDGAALFASTDYPRTPRERMTGSSPCARALKPISLASLSAQRRDPSSAHTHTSLESDTAEIVEIPVREADVSAQPLQWHSPTHLVAPFLHQSQEQEREPTQPPAPPEPERTRPQRRSRSCVSCLSSLYGHGPVWGNAKKVQDRRILSAHNRSFKGCLGVGAFAFLVFCAVFLPSPRRDLDGYGH